MNRCSRIALFCFLGRSLLAYAAVSPGTNAFVSSHRIEPASPIEQAQFGTFVATKSNVVVLGNQTASAPSNHLASVYRLDAESITLETHLTAPGATNIVLKDLSTDGQQIVIAASADNLPVLFIFHRAQNEWTLADTLRPSNEVRSVSMDRGTIVAGTFSDLLVYDRIANSWISTNISEPPTAKGSFGADVAISHDSIIVGAPGDPGGHPGGAFIFIRTKSSWQLQADLPGEFSLLMPVGNSVAIDKDTALVSAYPDRFDDGMVFVYQRSGTNWISAGTLYGDDGGGDFFGESVAVSGRNLIVGAPSTRNGGTVFIFRRNGAAFDTFRLTLNPGFFGWDVAADSSIIVAGAPHFSSQVLRNGAGAVFQFAFGPTLYSPTLNGDGDTFEFRADELTIGSDYILEKTDTLAPANWTDLKTFSADAPETFLNATRTSDTAFFRLLRQE